MLLLVVVRGFGVGALGGWREMVEGEVKEEEEEDGRWMAAFFE